jgi:hypothetical protein
VAKGEAKACGRTWAHLALLVALAIFGQILLRSVRALCSASTQRRNLREEIKRLRNRDQLLAIERDGDLLAGHHIICPYCMNSFEFIQSGSEMPSGLRHCYKCGQQFVTVNGYSYPLAEEAKAGAPLTN